MNTRVRRGLQSMNNGAVKIDQMVEMQRSKSIVGNEAAKNRKSSSRERKLALQKDVDKLKMKLRHEENIRRALERAFNRPLGALPRLPPYLPPPTLELLAEVAVLEEEIVRLEEQVVLFRKDLYQEAVYISNSKRNMESFADLYDLYPNKNLRAELSKSSDKSSSESTTGHAPTLSTSVSTENSKGKGNQLHTKSVKGNNGSPNQKAQSCRTPVKRIPADKKPAVKRLEQQKSRLDCGVTNQETLDASRATKNDNPNTISEKIVKCLSSIFLRMCSIKNRRDAETLPFLSTLVSQEHVEESEHFDPYGICSKFGRRDIGSYDSLLAIEADTINLSRTSNSLFLFHRLKLLFRKLESVNLQDLSHQEKLAFWINIYNSCMMNAFLENGIPESPEVVVALMQKATINVGGHFLNAITIEHFILRLPYHSKLTVSKGAKSDGMTARSKFGLELSEPLVTFALSCGSWSSPAVRVYTATHVENELEAAKKEYLKAAVGISPSKFAIPKLLDWYLLDFAKDLESLLDWICLQLPSELGKEAIKCLERGKSEPYSQVIQILPYDFSFRYLLYTQ